MLRCKGERSQCRIRSCWTTTAAAALLALLCSVGGGVDAALRQDENVLLAATNGAGDGDLSGVDAGLPGKFASSGDGRSDDVFNNDGDGVDAKFFAQNFDQRKFVSGGGGGDGESSGKRRAAQSVDDTGKAWAPPTDGDSENSTGSTGIAAHVSNDHFGDVSDGSLPEDPDVRHFFLNTTSTSTNPPESLLESLADNTTVASVGDIFNTTSELTNVTFSSSDVTNSTATSADASEGTSPMPVLDACVCPGPPCLLPPPSSRLSCPWNRTVSRPDCPCCSHPVCARQVGQSCNHDVLACDGELGLACDNDTNLCSGPFGLVSVETSHNSSQLRWRSVLSDTDLSSLEMLISEELTDNAQWIRVNKSLDRGTARVDGLHPGTLYFVKLIDSNNNSEVVILKTKGGCTENDTSYEIGEHVDVGCEQVCLCVANNETACSARICQSFGPVDVAAGEDDANCRMVPDPDDPCCTIRSCQRQREGHSLLAGEPQVIATGRSPVSLTIAWDDFKVPGPTFEHGYVVEFRPQLNGSQTAEAWNRLQVEDGPFTTIRNLTPNTAYEVRVSIQDDGSSDGARPSTGITVLTTADGCVWNGRPLAVGDKYETANCTSRCTCVGDDSSECGARCVDPYHARGNVSADSGCHEVDLDDDPCCVILACPSRAPPPVGQLDFEHGGSTTQRALVAASAAVVVVVGECPVRVRDESGWCESSCKSDADCPDRKCCLTECGSTVCAKPISSGGGTTTTTTSSSISAKPVVDSPLRNPCEDSVCGPNAMCKQYERNGLCHCLPGFSGDPYDARRGCAPVFQLSARAKSKAGCTFGNATYQVGETFYNGCEYKCQCINNKGKYEMSCQPRCQLKEEKMRSRDPSCHLRSDPDDDCCKVLVCETFENDAEERGSAVKNLSRLDNGCTFKGNKYKKDEQFFDGCESSCQCVGLEQITCNPRCALSPEVGPGCVELPPSSDGCCKVVVCEPSATEMLNESVANVTTDRSINFTTSNQTSDSDGSLLGSTSNNSTSINDTTSVANNIFGNGTTSSVMERGSSALNDSIIGSGSNVDDINFTNSMEESTMSFDTFDVNATTTNSSSSNSTTTDEDGLTFNGTGDGLSLAASSERNVTVSATGLPDTNATESETMTNETLGRNNDRPLFNESGAFLDTLEEDDALDSSTANATSEDSDFLSSSSSSSNATLFGDDGSSSDNVTSIRPDNSTDALWSFRHASSDSGGDVATSSNEVTTSSQAPKGEPRLLKDTVHRGRLASIYRVIVINPTMVRLQLVLAPSIMERMFMESGEGVLLLYTANLTHTDVGDWQRHPLALEHVGFVSVDRSDVAVEVIVSELQPGSQYNFVVAMPREGADPDLGLQYELLSEVAATVTIKLEGMCAFMGKSMPIGDRMYEECQTVCDCLPGLVVHCEAIMCPNQLSPEKSGCLEWNIDKSFIPRPTHCCPEATCKYGSVCTFKGQKFRNLERIPQELVDECDQECKCVAGNITCSPRCTTPALPPTDPDCLEPQLQLIEGDKCCQHWHCKRSVVEVNETTTEAVQLLSPDTVTLNTTTTENATTLTSTDPLNDLTNVTTTLAAETEVTTTAIPIECVYENATYRLNEQWRVGKGHRQKLCSCLLLHNGTAAAECQGGCPPILKQHKDLVTDCPPENVVVLDVPDLCPYVVCNKTDTGRGVKNVSVEPLNATAIRITFIIPNIYVGLYGHIEILYTMDLTHSEDTTTWNKEVFSGPSNQFENARLSHEMTGLQPDTEYFVKVLVIIKNTKNMDSSETLTIRMPPLPTTTTTTTTTTLPPKISLDARLNVSDIQSGSAKVTWRTFDESERRFIDGVQLQHKMATEDSLSWSQSALIHRDVNFYTLEHLKPDSVYNVDIVFVPPVNVSTEVLSESAISFRTLAVHDDFEFNLTLTVDKVSSYTIELIWTGVPYPEMKYINVYRIVYEQHSTTKDPETMQFYRQPNGKEFQVTIDQLVPDTNYTVHIDAYLSNGKVRSSNRINVPTKPGAVITKTSEKEKLEASQDSMTKNAGNTYYAALIVVAVIAALCALGFAILLVILLRKQSSAKAPITSSKSQSAYDNPSYKTYNCEMENGNMSQPHV